MSAPVVQRHRTALHRADISRPIRVALESEIINTEVSVFDYGCGRGEDLRRLSSLGISCSGWDPAFRPDGVPSEADVVNLGYVVNVIEDPHERIETLRRAWSLTRRVLVVSARLNTERVRGNFAACADGVLTQRATFQKFYEQQELREWIDSALGASSMPASPGVFFVFRDSAVAQSFLASRFRRRIVVPRIRRSERDFEAHREALVPLMDFVAARGRLPIPSEMGDAGARIITELGSVRNAFELVRKATPATQWDDIVRERADDLLVYLALSQFTRRPAVSELPPAMQLDIRAFFGNYAKACHSGDELLFAAGRQDEVSRVCAASPIGKCTSEALYLHIDALSGAKPLIRVYEGCARAYVGSVEDANIVKMHRLKPQVSYLAYPEFDSDPHPALRESLKVRFRGLQIEYRDYRESTNPFILHRKETFLPSDHPLRPKFERLTRQEETKGLLQRHSNEIGTRNGWLAALHREGYTLRGHRLIRERATESPPGEISLH